MRAKVDANHRAIAWTLKQTGCHVLSLAAVGNGCPDLLVYNPRTAQLHMLEVKDGEQNRRRLTPHQKRFHADWPVVVVTCIDEALEVVSGQH